MSLNQEFYMGKGIHGKLKHHNQGLYKHIFDRIILICQ